MQRNLGIYSDRRTSCLWLENIVVRFQEHHKPGTREKEPSIWHKDHYNQALGLWYAGEKFSPEAKADVEAKVATMIDVYKITPSNSRLVGS